MNSIETLTPTVDELLGQLQVGALKNSQQALTQAELDRTPESPQAAELKSSAEVLLSAGDLGLARNILRTMIRQGVYVGWALRTLGSTHENEGRTDLARRCYQDAIAYEPHLEAYRLLASLEIRSRNDSAAADATERALNLPHLSNRLRVELHKVSGNCWMRSQKSERAEKHYQRALQLDPTDDSIASNLGALYLQSGRIKDAVKSFEDAVTANPANAKALAGLGSAQLAEGRKREAHDCLARSLEIHLQQPTTIYHLVKCAYEIKSYATAARLLARYVEIAPVNANLLYSLGGLQFHLGRIDEASRTVSKILRIQPAHSGAAELQRLIQRYAQPGGTQKS
jgi:tetratricopeptide (TPR) repeat protein